MLKIVMNELHYEYDIRGLFMAFFPGAEIECVQSEEVLVDLEEGERLRIAVNYLDSAINLSCKSNSIEQKKSFPYSWEDKRAKNELKRLIYQFLSAVNKGKLLPWGTLTGIRPVKLPMAMLEEGKSEEEILDTLLDTYLLSEEKAKLSLFIAHKELALLNRLDYENGYSLYIGIPFCPTTCLYCSFTSYPFEKYEEKIWDYLHALEKEILYTAKKFKNKKLNSIYFGGGTPTTLLPDQLDWLLHLVTENFNLDDCLEWTVEGGRPDSITKEKLKVLRKYPVDRISINPQTMKQETLDIIGRRHSVEQIKEAYQMAREEGFDNINMDLILGLPEESVQDVKNTMEEIMAMNPDNLTVHTLALKRASRLNTQKEDYAHLHFAKNTQQMMQVTAKYAKEMNLQPYYLYRQKNMSGNLENIGYAREGKEGVYNILIMEEKQTIMALGAGAVTKRVELNGRITRASNVKNIEQYIERIDEMLVRKEQLFA